MNPHLEQAAELLAAAHRDRTTFRILRRDEESPLEVMLFHAQQALEKSIKAVLVCHGVIFRRTHDLLELAGLADTSGIALPLARDLLLRLGPYAVEFRYLGVNAPDVSVVEAEAAIESAVMWVESQIRNQA